MPANSQRKKPKSVAVFDIDGTIFRSSLLIELTDALIERGILSRAVRKIYLRPYRDWLDRKGPYGDYINAVVEAFEKHIKGAPYKKLEHIAARVAVAHRDRVYRYTRGLVKDLKKKKYYLLAISHSPLIIVESFARKMGFDKVYGRMFELDNNNKFTARVLYKELIDDKAKILERAMKKENLTLKNSVGVGDTDSDIPFLKMVERPICFNPNQKLYNYAKRRGWQIVVERKDVIYKI